MQKEDSRYPNIDLHSDILQERDVLVLEFLDRLNLKKGMKILDLGCGPGFTSINLLKRGFNVTALDVSEEMISIARKNCTYVGFDCEEVFSVGNAEQLDLPDDAYDAVVATGVIENVTWDRWAFQEIQRVIKPGGHLIVNVPNNIGLSYITNPSHLISNFKALSRIPADPTETDSETIQEKKNAAYKNFYFPSRFRQMLSGLDFEIIDSVSHGFGPFALVGQFKRLSIKLEKVLRNYSKCKGIHFFSKLGDDYIVLCQKRETPLDINERQIFTNYESRIKLFLSTQKNIFSRREAWLKKNPEYSHPDILQFDAETYPGRNVLVLSPHPDDEIIGCGGTLIKMLNGGSFVTIIQLTDGSETYSLKTALDNVRKTIRLQEAKDVADNLGINELILLGEEQSHFRCSEDMVNKISDIVNRVQPQVIFVPFINDSHPDHVIANEILCKSLETTSSISLADINVFSYEVWSLVPPNSFCIIDDTFDKKIRVLMRYRTGMKVFDYKHLCETLNSYHAYTLLGKKGYAEVFLNIDAKKYVTLIRNQQNNGNVIQKE